MATIPYENGKKMSDLTVLTEAADDAKLFIHDGTGMKCISAGNLKKDIKALVNAAQSTINAIATTGAGAHNSIYRGKNLGTSVTAAQYPLFAFRPDMISNRQWYWLRDVVSAAYFAYVLGTGFAGYSAASSALGVRPAFSIIG